MKGKYRKGVFILVYKNNKKREYLILRRILHWKGWEFPKGGIEPQETAEKAVKRELKEEIGLKAKEIFRFNKRGKFNYNKKFEDRQGLKGQDWRLFAVEVFPGKIKIDRREHLAYKWLEFKKARKLLTWKNQKECLKIIERKLNK